MLLNYEINIYQSKGIQMLNIEEQKIIADYADAISVSDGGVDFEFLNKRIVKEKSSDWVRVTDYVFGLEDHRDYGCAIRHPEEEKCLPLLIDRWTIKMDLKISRNGQFEIVDEKCNLVYESFFIYDKEVPDKLIIKLLAHRYFDERSQILSSDLKEYLVKFFKAKHVEKTEKCKVRIAPFIGIQYGVSKSKYLTLNDKNFHFKRLKKSLT